MERATKSEKAVQTEWALREYCDELALESISMFRRSGSLLFSSDSSLQQPQDAKWLFDSLDLDVLYDIGFDPLVRILIQDKTRCLIVKPIDIDSRIGWYFALGNLSDMKCSDLAQNIIEHAETNMVDEYIDYFVGDVRRDEIQILSDLPMILGTEFEMDNDSVVIVQTEEGVLIDRPDRPLWAVSIEEAMKPSPLLERLGDMNEYILTVIWGYSEFGVVKNDKQETPESKAYSIRSDSIFKAAFILGIFISILAFVYSTYTGILFIILGGIVIPIIFVAISDEGKGCNYCFAGFAIIVCMIVAFILIQTFILSLDFAYFIGFLITIFIILMSILLVRNVPKYVQVFTHSK